MLEQELRKEEPLLEYRIIREELERVDFPCCERMLYYAYKALQKAFEEAGYKAEYPLAAFNDEEDGMPLFWIASVEVDSLDDEAKARVKEIFRKAVEGILPKGTKFSISPRNYPVGGGGRIDIYIDLYSLYKAKWNKEETL